MDGFGECLQFGFDHDLSRRWVMCILGAILNNRIQNLGRGRIWILGILDGAPSFY